MSEWGLIKKIYILFEGVHVHQILAGCELLNDDKPGPLHSWDAFDGQCLEEFTYDLEQNDIHVKKPWMILWDQVKRLHIQLCENVYHPICIKVLRRYLHLEKNNVMRKGERINLIIFSIIKIGKKKFIYYIIYHIIYDYIFYIINKYDPDSSTDRKCVPLNA